MHIGMHKHANMPSFVSSTSEQLLCGQKWTDLFIKRPLTPDLTPYLGLFWNHLGWGLSFILFICFFGFDYFFCRLGATVTRRQGVRQLKGRTGEDTTTPNPTDPTGQTQSSTQQRPGKQGCKNKLGRNSCGVYFCVSFLTLNVGQLTVKVKYDCVVCTAFFFFFFVFFK